MVGEKVQGLAHARPWLIDTIGELRLIVVQLGTQQSAQAGGAGVFARKIKLVIQREAQENLTEYLTAITGSSN